MSRPNAAALIVLALTALTARTVGAQCTAFFDQFEFETYCQTHAKVPKGIETFEESNIGPSGKQPLPAPLDLNPNTVGGIGFPNGLEQQNLIIQDNVSPGPSPPFPNPSGDPTALFVIGPGFNQSNSIKVGEDLFLQGIWASLDLIFTEPNHTGIGFLLSRFQNYQLAPWSVTVYDKSDQVIGAYTVAPTGFEPSKTFFGIWCPQTIGRINIYDTAGAEPDVVDDIQMWLDLEQEQLYQTAWQRAVHCEFVLMPPFGHLPVDQLQILDPRWISEDGIGFDPDIIIKSASICNTDTLCTTVPTTWEKVNCDPTDPRYRREAWWSFPPVSALGVSPDMDIVFSLPVTAVVPLAGWYEVDYMVWLQCEPIKGGTFRFYIRDAGVGAPEFDQVFDDDRILRQNFPNPFRPETTISYHLERGSHVKLSVYDVHGALVCVLTDGFREAGPHQVSWNGCDEAGNRVASGVYFYEIQAGNIRESRKMIRLR